MLVTRGEVGRWSDRLDIPGGCVGRQGRAASPYAPTGRLMWSSFDAYWVRSALSGDLMVPSSDA